MRSRRSLARWLTLPALPVALVLGGPSAAAATGTPALTTAVSEDADHQHGHIGPVVPSASPDAHAGHDMTADDMTDHESMTADEHASHGGTPTTGSAGGHDSHGTTAEDSDHDDGGHGTGGHDDTGPAPDRPRALVLGGFGAFNGLVLATAAVLRRRGAADRRRRSRAARASAGDATL